MCRKDTHAMRGHRAQRNYKPVCKEMKNRERKRRREVRVLIGEAGGKTAGEALGAR